MHFVGSVFPTTLVTVVTSYGYYSPPSAEKKSVTSRAFRPTTMSNSFIHLWKLYQKQILRLGSHIPQTYLRLRPRLQLTTFGDLFQRIPSAKCFIRHFESKELWERSNCYILHCADLRQPPACSAQLRRQACDQCLGQFMIKR